MEPGPVHGRIVAAEEGGFVVEHADLVLLGGGVYTLDAARPWAEAVAVRGGRIVHVGVDADVRALVGPGTDVIDLRGKLLLPGFQDAHAHPLVGGVERLQCDLTGGQTIAEYRDLGPGPGGSAAAR